MPLEIGTYISTGVLSENPLLDPLLLGDGALFVISEVLRSPEISVVAKSSNGQAVALDIPAISQAVQGKLEVKAEHAQSSTITFKGDNALAFAFKCYEIGIAGGQLTFAQTDPGAVALESGTTPSAHAALLSDQALVDFGSIRV